VSPATIANLERTMRAFVALVSKLELIGEDPEFRHIFRVSLHPYEGPTWEAELAEAQACLREAETLATGPQAADAEVPGAAVSERTGG
jgi:hypothetical protein